MRKSLVHLLMLVMLMPGLACGPFMAAGEAHAAAVEMKGMPHCHGMSVNKDAGSKKTSGKDATMLFKDCAKTDLQKADGHAGQQKPDPAGGLSMMAFADVVTHDTLLPQNQSAIRGPPPDWPALSHTQPSLLLTTRRFRE